MEPISRRAFLLGAMHTGAAALLAGCARQIGASESSSHALDFADYSSAMDKPPLATAMTQAFPIPDAPLEQKIGQMLLVGFGGQYLTADAPIVEAVRDGKVGSTVLFGHNISGAEQLRTLTQTLQDAAAIPLLITLDQEGGYVSRLGPWAGIEPNYSAQYLGDLNDLGVTRLQGMHTAAALRDLGVNLNLAPVVDLNTNPWNPVIGGVQRSYSADPDRVWLHARATVDAHHEQGVGCTLKHFPGHGSSQADTHLGFVDVTGKWTVREIAPYARLIAANDVDAIMTAHIYNAELDPDAPATLSKRVVTGLLRDKLGYDGVIVTDDMRMRAISDLYAPKDAIFRAIDAGVDLIAISNNIPGKEPITALRAFDLILELVESGRLSAQRIDESYRRVLALKQRLNRVHAPA